MSTEIGTILQGRFSSIEGTEAKALKDNTSIELPQAIKELITGSDYWVRAKSNRYKKLIRDGHLDKLLKLAEVAQTKDNPANWFAKACSKAAWERTLAYLTKLAEVVKKAELVAERLGVEVNKFVYKMIWQRKPVEHYAAVASESGRNPVAYFNWLCRHGLNGSTHSGRIATQWAK